MEDPYCEMPAGLTGIVDSVDDLDKFIAIGKWFFAGAYSGR